MLPGIARDNTGRLVQFDRLGGLVSEVKVEEFELGGIREVGVKGSSNCSCGEQGCMLTGTPGKSRGPRDGLLPHDILAWC